jgi:hypothetical protein
VRLGADTFAERAVMVKIRPISRPEFTLGEKREKREKREQVRKGPSAA